VLDFADSCWIKLTAGYRVAVDLRPSLQALERADDLPSAWQRLWPELYHRGDVGNGSFAAMPHLVRIHRQRGEADWNTYALVATIELARGRAGNPDVPEWMADSYEDALRDLGRIGLAELPQATDGETVRSILGLLAIVHGAALYGRALIALTEGELSEGPEAASGAAGDQ